MYNIFDNVDLPSFRHSSELKWDSERSNLGMFVTKIIHRSHNLQLNSRLIKSKAEKKGIVKQPGITVTLRTYLDLGYDYKTKF